MINYHYKFMHRRSIPMADRISADHKNVVCKVITIITVGVDLLRSLLIYSYTIGDGQSQM